MARPALSAARGIEIIDLLAAEPGRGLTLSDIARRAGINVASCHAVLTVLVTRGYLRREGKAYGLGPALFAAGQAALAAQGLLGHVETAARGLFAELGCPVSVTAAVAGGAGEEVIGVLSLGSGERSLLSPGARRAMVPPTGAAFIAWSDAAAIDDWAARSPDQSPATVEALRRGALAMRDRGFEVLLEAPESAGLASQLRAFSAVGALHMGPGMVLLETVEEARPYDVLMIAAPVFDRDGACAFNLCLGPFGEPLAGRRVLDLADRMLAACVSVMQADRAR